MDSQEYIEQEGDRIVKDVPNASKHILRQHGIEFTEIDGQIVVDDEGLNITEWTQEELVGWLGY